MTDSENLRDHFSTVAKIADGEAKTISLGNIIDDEAKTIFLGNIIDEAGSKHSLRVELSSLRRQTLICGTTGSGKTNTCLSLLRQLWHHRIPFLVIDPAKASYRNLMTSEEFKGAGRVYTLGNLVVSPLRLNPFQLLQGVNVQAHIDALTTMFNASFEMYAPMPLVLNKAISELYVARGWDLFQSTNIRLPEGINHWDPDCPQEVYPSMDDLYESITKVTDSFNYSDRIGPDVCAALRARIGSLIAGPKGMMFDRSISVPFDTLFSQPVVVELHDVFNDNEKSFLSGMLLLFLSYYRKLHPAPEGLNHVLLVDDAHRLLKAEFTEKNQDAPAGHFATVFPSMLSELGSYGEGIVVSTQTPASLIPSILSNTNLKVIHRLLTDEDVRAVSGPQYLDEFHRRHVATLAVGRALCYSDSMEMPYRLAVETPVEPWATTIDSDFLVQGTMKGFEVKRSGDGFEPGFDDLVVYRYGLLIAKDSDFQTIFSRYVLSTAKDLTQLVHFRQNIVHEVQRIVGGSARIGKLSRITWAALVLATRDYFDKKGQEHFLFYGDIREQQLRWLSLLKPAFVRSQARRRLEIGVLREWRDGFLALQKRDQGPHPTCGPCKSKCIYRMDVAKLVSDPAIKFDFNSSINRPDSPASESAAWFSRLLAERYVGQGDVDLSYCMAVHLLKEQSLSTDAQLVLLNKVRTILESFEDRSAEEVEAAPNESDEPGESV